MKNATLSSSSPLELLERLNLPNGRPVTETVCEVNAEPQIIQDYKPLDSSLEWMLSDLCWNTNGVLSFARNQVPFIINNTGRLSENAAAVLFTNCLESLPSNAPIKVLELGAGTGLFALFFLNAFRDLCTQEDKDFYNRLTYYASDRSQRTIEQWIESKMFATHEGRVRLGTSDATKPTTFNAFDAGPIEINSIHAVFLNYVLDVLPFAIIRTGKEGPEQMFVRTHFTKYRHLLPQYSQLSFEEARALAATDDKEGLIKLLPLLTLLELETRFFPVANDSLPFMEDGLAFGKELERFVLNYGAISCLETCAQNLCDEGFIIINDYGPVESEQIPGHAATQRFGFTTALGVNFPFMENYFSKSGLTVLKPDGDETRRIYARMITRKKSALACEAFNRHFSASAYEYFESPIEEAARHSAAGRSNEALDSFRVALARNPKNWHLIGQAAEFVGLQLRDFQAGLELTRAAIELNPWYSAWLWNVLGDCLFCLERFSDAHEAYLQAQKIDPNDARTNFNLSYTYFHYGLYEEALTAIGKSFANDASNAYRERLLDKQQQILAALNGKQLGEQERMANRALSFT